MPSNRPQRLRRARAVVALARARLRGTGWGRAGVFLGRAVATGFGAVAIGLRGIDGAGASLSGLVITAAHWVPWVAGVPIAFAAARDLASADRREGVDALAAARGVSSGGRDAARVLAAMAEVASSIGVPLVVLAALTVALAGKGSIALYRASLGLGAVVFAIVAGVTLGGLGAIAGRVGRARGGTLLVVLVAGPWVIADLAGHPGWSIPGALAAVLDFAMGARGAGVTPILVLDRVYARDAAGPRGRARGAIVEASLALGAAVHAVLGAPEDGALAFFDAVTGARAPNRGRVTLAGRDPARTPFLRARIGALPPEPRLPAAATVGAAVKIAMRARGEPGDRFDTVLDPLGLGRLHARSPASLSFAEARGVELCLALSTPAPLLVALHDPLCDVTVTPREAVGRRLRELAATGACVLVVTSSPADARSLADHVVVLHKGLVGREVTGGAGLTPADEVELTAWTATAAGARALCAGLAQRAEVHAVAWEEGGGAWPAAAAVRVRGEAAACALAVADAALAAGVEVEAITSHAPGMGEVRATTEALWKAARANPARANPGWKAAADPSQLAPGALTRVDPNPGAPTQVEPPTRVEPPAAHAQVEPPTQVEPPEPPPQVEPQATPVDSGAVNSGRRPLVTGALPPVVTEPPRPATPEVALGIGVAMGRARVARRPTMLSATLGAALVVVAALIERREGTAGAVDRTLAATLSLVVPLVSFGVAAEATGRGNLRDAVWPAARYGVARADVALGTIVAAAGASALLGAIFAGIAVLAAHADGNPPLGLDLLTSGWIGALTAAAYAAWFTFGATFGRRGGGRWLPLFLDFAVRGSAGTLAAMFPWGHAANLLGSTRTGPLGMGQAESSLVLVGMIAALAALAALRSRE